MVREGSHCCPSTQEYIFKIHFLITLTGLVCNEHLSDNISNYTIAKLGHIFGNVTLLASSGQIYKSKTSIPATMEGSAQLQPRLQGFLPPTSTWGVVGFHVVDNWVLQGCYNALVGFLEGCNEVVHLSKEPPGDPRRCLQSQRGEVRRAAGYPVLAHRPRPQKCTQLPGKEPAME